MIKQTNPRGRIFRRGISMKLLLIALALVAVGAGVWIWLKREVVPEYNIVLITFDTTRADRIGCYGAETARTPTLDTMARNGIRYDRCIATTPITQPSHTSLLTGLYPIRHGIQDNGVASLSENAVTLPEILRDTGYKTGAVIGAFVLDSQFGLDQGFDSYNDDLSKGTKRKFTYLERKAEAVTDAALNWVDSVQDSKFFLWAHYFDPHADYSPPGIDPKPFLTSLDGLKKLYDLEISYTDNQLGRLMHRVRQIEESTGRPTLFIFTSDHGESLGNHDEPTHGLFVYEDTIHVPLIIYDSQSPKRNVSVERPVSIVDVMPTILERLKLPLPYEIDGRRLPKYLDDGDSVDQDRAVYFESVMPYTNYGWSPLAGVILGKHKLISAPKPEFYDLELDPIEANNLYKENDDQIEELVFALEDINEATLNHPDLTVNETMLSATEVRKLMSLGYLSAKPEARNDDEDLPDPKDRIHLHRQLLNARSFVVNGKIGRAFDEVRAIIQEDPENGRCHDTLVQMVIDHRDALSEQEVIPLLRRWLELHPSVNTAVALGMMYEKAGNAASALQAFNKAVELDRDNSDLAALNNSAYYLYKLDGDMDLALERAERVVELLKVDPDLKDAPASGHARHTLACILLKLGRTEEGIKYLQEATKFVPNFASAFYHLGVARQTLGENEMASKLLSHAVKLAQDKKDPDWLPDAKSRLNEVGQ